MGLTTVTIDTNTLHEHHAAKLHSHVSGKTILLPDVVVAENFNHPNWERFSIEQLARLQPYLTNVQPGDVLTRLLREELRTGYPAKYRIDPYGMAEVVRSDIEMCANDPIAAKQKFSERVHVVQTEMARRQGDTYQRRRNYDFMVNDLLVTFGAERLAQACDDLKQVPLLMSEYNVVAKNEESLRHINRTTKRTSRIRPEFLSRLDSAFTRLNCTLFCYSIWVHRRKPHEEHTAEKLLGMQGDNDIATIGSYTEELYTNDVGAKTINKMLKLCISEHFPR